ncbi:DUF3592 domain-containing protein [Teredinibacter sp. KSP-S5-2]|uniref:DUF3592 domain-containing protein n=1 Tax=Teredinibacter sp. KSP-S5-2 TaxID=3034506 RepID=UPI0029346D53|nr:DUF3592 domain-containing protein [Teredinibacter sp. KSP-S5-2]WNO07766.1 DUF3592 domain-containing protein [Teredinibacter sp. KSP-S5-2]
MKTIVVIKYIFTLVGLGLLLGAFFVYKNTQDFMRDSLAAEGVVVDLVRSRSSDSTTYRPVVQFETRDGTLVEFTSSMGSNPPSYSRGEVVQVLYQSSSPEQAKINGFFSLWGAAVILGGLGAVFSLVGASIIVFGNLTGRKIEYLKQNGVRVKAKFQSVERNKSLSVNGRNPYKIYAQWKNPTTGKLHVFSSENIWFDPTDHIHTDDISVLIDKGNPKKHYIDISFLPEVAD